MALGKLKTKLPSPPTNKPVPPPAKKARKTVPAKPKKPKNNNATVNAGYERFKQGNPALDKNWKENLGKKMQTEHSSLAAQAPNKRSKSLIRSFQEHNSTYKKMTGKDWIPAPNSPGTSSRTYKPSATAKTAEQQSQHLTTFYKQFHLSSAEVKDELAHVRVPGSKNQNLLGGKVKSIAQEIKKAQTKDVANLHALNQSYFKMPRSFKDDFLRPYVNEKDPMWDHNPKAKSVTQSHQLYLANLRSVYVQAKKTLQGAMDIVANRIWNRVPDKRTINPKTLTLGTYDLAPRGVDGHADIPKLIQYIKNTKSNTFDFAMFNMDPKKMATNLGDLERLLAATRNNKQLGLYSHMVGPSELEGERLKNFLPYKLDYIGWFKKFEALKKTYPSFKGVIMDDMRYNLRPNGKGVAFTESYVNQLKQVAPHVQFYALDYAESAVQNFGKGKYKGIDGVVYAYREDDAGRGFSTKTIKSELMRVCGGIKASGKKCVFMPYAERMSYRRAPSKPVLDEEIRTGIEAMKKGIVDGQIVYLPLQHESQDTPLLRQNYGNATKR